MAGRLGRLAPHSPDTHPRLRLAQFLRTGTLPAIPERIDRMSKVDAWPMYLNDQLGDCTCAAAGHMIEAWTAYGAGHTVRVTDQDVLTAYKSVSGYNPDDPNSDQGAVMQDVLDYWRSSGIGGHRIVAFAEVDVRNLGEVYAALYLFGHIYVGVNLPNAALDQFDQRKPWSVATDDGGIAGGHAIDLGWRNSDVLQVVTWGRQQPTDEAWWGRYVEEAWIAISPEWLTAAGTSPEGIDVAALNSAFTRLTGQPGPFPDQPNPDPTPPPVPGSTPGGDPADVALAVAVGPWLTRHHRGESRKVAQALTAWKQAKGL